MMTGYHFFLLYMGLLLAGGLVAPMMVLVLHFLMPDAVLERYWRQPYMRLAELAFFTGTLFAPMRTVMLIWVIAFPRFGKKRGILAADKLAPRWYRIAAQVVSILIVASAGSVLLLTIGGFIYAYAIGDPVPLT